MPAPDLNIEDIHVGDYASFTHSFSEADVAAFAKLVGDMNPLHMDDAYAQSTKFGRRIVHGMLVAGLSSRFVGMHIPGRRCLYLGETFAFKHPVFINDSLTVRGKVQSVSPATRVVRIALMITKSTGEEVLSGTADVQIL